METKRYRPIEAARILGISKETLLSYEREGRIPETERDENGNRIYTFQDLENIRDLFNLRPVLSSRPICIAVFNMKGGVGKSTVSSNLAWKLAESGYRTLAMDADPQGHMTTSLGEEPSAFNLTLMQMLVPDGKKSIARLSEVACKLSPNLHLVPANLSMCSMNLYLFQQPEREYRLRRALESVRESAEYDVMVIDSPPSYDLTSLNILLACDILLAPVKLDGNSFYGLQYLFDSIRDISGTYRHIIPKILIIPNNYNSSYSVSRQILEGLTESYGEYITRTVIRQDVSFDKANALRQPVFLLSPSCKGSRDLENLMHELTEIIKGKE
ncbi:AAA family ATPase [Desulfomonile tiedjei]|uniref:ATPase involved in chromosome partitioning n=1 Tax=Desulfomonile tiedjei (strain ATCC 49306 / DSM 6799 / DCB-1) TaxID=706587 RepID=I4C677_DESTA|nr:AAA family ATPase [Desulfomonile tiedjei]AFM25068.1 ATPase involved in chromosome partitioning [Desulfomonile tiedjei DSM 6799]